MDKERASYNLKEVSLALPCHLVQHTMALIARSSLLSILGLRTVASRTGVLYWKLTFVRADQHIQCPCSWGGARNSGCRKVGTSRSSVRSISKHAHSRFPAQEHSTGASKVPTIIYYDQNGNVRAIGAEATNNGIAEAAEDGNWIKAEWCVVLSPLPHREPTDQRRFKLHLQPKFGEGQNISNQVPPLPPNKTVIEVFADFLKYLLRCAEAYIIDMHPSGANLWAALSDDIHFVLSHPNGWKGKEQSQMLQAAIKPGLVPNIPAGHERVSFMTEGEVSLYFTIENNDLSQIQKVYFELIIEYCIS